MITDQKIVIKGKQKRICRTCYTEYNPILKTCPKCTDISGGVSFPDVNTERSNPAQAVSYEFVEQVKKVK